MPASSTAPGAAVSVASGDGHHAQLTLLGDETGAGPGLLWLPALGVPARKYRHFATGLAERGWTVALHEWRGHESSDRRAARHCDWGYAELLRDIEASRLALSERQPQRHWIVGGHSLGGQLAALAFAQQPPVYAGYLVAGSGQPWWRCFPGWHKLGLLAAIVWFRALSAACGYFPGHRLGFGGREARGVMRDWARSAASGDYRPAQVDTDLELALRRAQGQALALRLASDLYVPAASLDYLLGKLPAMTIRRADIGDTEFAGGRAGHFDWMRDPLPLVERIDAWARELALDGTSLAPQPR